MVVVVHPAPVQPCLPPGHRLDLEEGGAAPGDGEAQPPWRGQAGLHPVPGRPGQINVVVSETRKIAITFQTSKTHSFATNC